MMVTFQFQLNKFSNKLKHTEQKANQGTFTFCKRFSKTNHQNHTDKRKTPIIEIKAVSEIEQFDSKF